VVVQQRLEALSSAQAQAQALSSAQAQALSLAQQPLALPRFVGHSRWQRT
jgi:hypothetical protein